MNTTKKLSMTLQIPLNVTINALQADQEEAYVERCMSQPGNCDNDLSESENRSWFRAVWTQQLRFQEALQRNPQYLASVLRYMALEKMAGQGLFGEPFLAAPEIDDVIAPIAESINAEEHFCPPASWGVDTWTLLSDLLQGIDVRLAGEPVLA